MGKKNKKSNAMPWLLEEVGTTSKQETSPAVSLGGGASPSDDVFDTYIKKKTQPKGNSSSGHKKRLGLLTILLIIACIVILLVTMWVAVGLLMKLEVLPWMDFGYSWLDGLVKSART